MKPKKPQRYILFIGRREDYAYGGRVFVGSAVANGSMDRLMRRVQATNPDKLEMIAFGTASRRADAGFRASVSEARIQGNWYRVTHNVLRAMELLNGDVVVAA